MKVVDKMKKSLNSIGYSKNKKASFKTPSLTKETSACHFQF